MRRVILAVAGTIAGLVALLSFKSHVPSAPVAATTGGAGGTSSSSSSSSASSSSSGGGQTEVVPGAFPQGSIAKNLPAGETQRLCRAYASEQIVRQNEPHPRREG